MKHASSVCVFDDAFYLAFYDCEREGWTQKVKILRKEPDGDNKWEFYREYDEGTGNPVLFNWQDEMFIAMTKFKDNEETRKIIDVSVLWSLTDLEIYVAGNASIASQPPIAKWPCLGCRNVPLAVDDLLLLPCYDETLRFGVVLQIEKDFIRTGALSRHSVIGIHRHFQHMNVAPYASKIEKLYDELGSKPVDIIQPSLFLDEEVLVAFSRSFRHLGGKEHKAIVSKYDHRFGWANFNSTIPNHNESCDAFSWNKENWVIYNDQELRKKLTIASLKTNKKLELAEGLFACYPSHCFDPEGGLYVCFTCWDTDRTDKWIRLLKIDPELKISSQEDFRD